MTMANLAMMYTIKIDENNARVLENVAAFFNRGAR